MAISSVRNAAENAAHDAAPWIERLARIGYVAKAVLYMTMGALAAAAGLGMGGDATTDSRGAMAEVVRAPFGRTLLAAIALGLIGYAAWRIICGIADAERRGTDAKGIAHRVRHVATGLLHAGLAISAAKFALGDHSDGGGGGETRSWVARTLDAPYGDLLLWGAALIFIGYGAYQLYRAWKSKLSKQLALGRMSREAGRWVIGVSRFGIASRGIVFGTIGVLLARAANAHDAKEAGGISSSLGELINLGKWPFVAIALGLVAYGVYELLNARYRRIRAV